MTSNQKKTCDRLWQIKVTGGQCSYPGCNRLGTEGHHIFKRRYLNTRWDIENGRALCRECHLHAHNTPQDYEDCILSEIGEIGYDRLRSKALMVRKQFYDEILKELKEG